MVLVQTGAGQSPHVLLRVNPALHCGKVSSLLEKISIAQVSDIPCWRLTDFINHFQDLCITKF